MDQDKKIQLREEFGLTKATNKDLELIEEHGVDGILEKEELRHQLSDGAITDIMRFDLLREYAKAAAKARPAIARELAYVIGIRTKLPDLGTF